MPSEQRESVRYSYVTRWQCCKCSSEDLQIAVDWVQSVEDVDQDSERLEPVGSGSGDAAEILRGFCNDCNAEGEPAEIFQRRRYRVYEECCS